MTDPSLVANPISARKSSSLTFSIHSLMSPCGGNHNRSSRGFGPWRSASHNGGEVMPSCPEPILKYAVDVLIGLGECTGLHQLACRAPHRVPFKIGGKAFQDWPRPLRVPPGQRPFREAPFARLTVPAPHLARCAPPINDPALGNVEEFFFMKICKSPERPTVPIRQRIQGVKMELTAPYVHYVRTYRTHYGRIVALSFGVLDSYLLASARLVALSQVPAGRFPRVCRRPTLQTSV